MSITVKELLAACEGISGDKIVEVNHEGVIMEVFDVGSDADEGRVLTIYAG